MSTARWFAAALLCCAQARPAHAGAPVPNPAFTEALAACVPGASFDDCAQKLQAAQVHFDPPRPGGHRELLIALLPPWELVQINTEESAAGRITQVRFQGRIHPGKPRREILDWLKAHLALALTRDAVHDTGCGADGGGPAWFSTLPQTYARQPEVQFAIDQFKTLRGPAGRPMDEVIVDTPNELEHLCFRLAHDKDGSYAAPTPLTTSAADFIRNGPAKSRPQLHPYTP